MPIPSHSIYHRRRIVPSAESRHLGCNPTKTEKRRPPCWGTRGDGSICGRFLGICQPSRPYLRRQFTFSLLRCKLLFSSLVSAASFKGGNSARLLANLPFVMFPAREVLLP